MPKVNVIQTNFTSGELSPVTKARADTTRFNNGAERIENFFVKPQGGLFFRTGTRFLNEVKFSSRKTIIQEFTFSNEQSYILEFGHLYIRVYRGDGIILSGGIPVELITPYTEDQLSELYFAQSADVLFITHQAHKPKRLSRLSDTSWTLSDLVIKDGPYLSPDTSDTTLSLFNIVYRATITSTANDFASGDVNKFIEYVDDGFLVVGQIKTFVSATEVVIEPKDNVIASSTIDERAVVEYAASSGSFPNRLRATTTIWGSESENSYIKVGSIWYFTGAHLAKNEEIPEVVGPPKAPAYSVDVITVASTLSMLSTSGILAISNKAITADVVASKDLFNSTIDVGRNLRLVLEKHQLWGTISSVVSPKSATLSLQRSIPLDPKNPNQYLHSAKTVNFRFGAWYTGNYPRCVTIHEQRLTFASTPKESQMLWFSEAQDFESFSPSEKDSLVIESNAITVPIGADTANAIQWLQSGPVLLVGSNANVWQVKPSSISEPLSPQNISITFQSPVGSITGARPRAIGSTTTFLHRSGRSVAALSYSFEEDRFIATDITIAAEHILREGGRGIRTSYQQEPNTQLLIVREDGLLAVCTYNRGEQVIAWSKYRIGGTNAKVESIATIPSQDGSTDRTYLVVSRTINSTTKRYIERLGDEFWPTSSSDKNNMVFLDSHLSYSGAPVSTISGLSHLEGQTVRIVADGSVFPDRVVTSGSITLDRSASIVHVGIPYRGLLKTLNVEGGSEFGVSQAKNKKISMIHLRVLNSLGYSYGPTEAEIEVFDSFRTDSDAMDSSPLLFTGDTELRPWGGYEKDGQFFIAQDQPYPLNILGIITTFKTNE